jgi:hypothetical protein
MRQLSSQQTSALELPSPSLLHHHTTTSPNHQFIKPTDAMDKIKSMFGKDKHHDDASSSAQPTTMPAGGAQSGGNPDNAEGVVLHTNLGDITIALFKDQTPRVSFNA